MEEFVVGSFNLHNHYWQKGWDGGNYPNILANFIKKYNIKFLGVQELVRPYTYKLQKNLGKNYTIIGGYRYGNIKLLKQFNESNAIITNENINSSKTKFLATVPILDHGTQMPRILTSVETDNFFMINTHLEYWNKMSQVHQLKKLYKYILQNRDKNPVITGDFNVDTSKSYFIDFISSLKENGISMVPIETPTYKTKKQILDYIFVPDEYDIIDYKVGAAEDVEKISDHSPVLVKLKKR